MNKLEKISLHSALKISKPDLNLCYHPIPLERFITFDYVANNQSKDYKFWVEVIDLLLPILKANKISIIRIGENNKKITEGVYNYTDKSFGQNAYIISKSLLHFNANNYLSYLANILEIPLVSIFSSIESNYFPFPKGENDIFINSPKNDKNPTFSNTESPKTIDNIDPSKIASAILDSLGLENNLKSIGRIFYGEMSDIKTIEIVPDFTPPADFMPGSLVNLRADYSFDEQSIFHFSQNRQLGIITKKALSESLLYSCLNSIKRISVNCEGGVDQSFLKNLKKFGINYELFCKDKSILPKLRLENIDETIEFYEEKQKPLDFLEKDVNNMFVRSSKILFSKGKSYATKAHWIIDHNLTPEPQPYLDTSDFWQDSDFLTIYKTKN